MAPNPLADFGGGLSSKSTPNHPSGPPQHGPTGQAERAFTAASTFLSGILAISATQLLGAPLKMVDPMFYDAYMAFTKQSFGVLVTTMTQWWSPTVVRVSGDTSIPKQLFRKPDGSLECKFPKRIVLMANHQLYTDWLYLWWVAYTNNMHGYIYIILKESLKSIPIFGWGAQFYNFIFLSRKWETDKDQFKAHLDQLNNPNDPMWLLIFPEGTNLAKGTKQKSAEWAKKTGVQDMKHQLLPRSRGLQFCLQNLRETTEWLYDCTIGYEGIPKGEFGQDIFTLRSSMFEGRPPKSVNMHFRRFRISTIPIDDDVKFDVWLRNRWREKDYLLEHFVQYDRFPEDDKWLVKQKQAKVKKIGPKNAKFIETMIKSNNLEEFLSIFAPLSSVMTVLFLLNGGGNPSDILKMVGDVTQQQQLVGLLKDEKSQKQALRMLESKGAAIPNMASLSALQKSNLDTLSPTAKRNLMQKYITAVRPMVEQQIALPQQSLRLSNAGKGELSLRSNQKPGPLVHKVSAKLATKAPNVGKANTVSSGKTSIVSAGQPSKLVSKKISIETLPSNTSTSPTGPRTAGLSSTRSIAPSSSVSTAPSTKQRTVPAGKAPIKPWAAQKRDLQPTKSAPSTKLNTSSTLARPVPSRTGSTLLKPEVKKETPTIKMEKATYDRLREKNIKAQSDAMKKVNATPSAIQSVKIDPAILAKMKANSKPILKSAQTKIAGNAPVKSMKSVQIDPAVLARMKENQKA